MPEQSCDRWDGRRGRLSSQDGVRCASVACQLEHAHPSLLLSRFGHSKRKATKGNEGLGAGRSVSLSWPDPKLVALSGEVPGESRERYDGGARHRYECWRLATR